jgi:prefoldin subunit 5
MAMAETTPEQLRNAGFTEAQATVLGSKLDYIEMRLDHIEARLDKVEARLEKLESRMTQILLALPALFIAQTTALALILG